MRRENLTHSQMIFCSQGNRSVKHTPDYKNLNKPSAQNDCVFSPIVHAYPYKIANEHLSYRALKKVVIFSTDVSKSFRIILDEIPKFLNQKDRKSVV